MFGSLPMPDVFEFIGAKFRAGDDFKELNTELTCHVWRLVELDMLIKSSILVSTGVVRLATRVGYNFHFVGTAAI